MHRALQNIFLYIGTSDERYGDFADTVSRYLDQVKKLADTKRETAETQAKLLA